MTRFRAVAVVGVCALSGAVAFWLNARVDPPIADATRTPGLLEWVASLAATARPSARLAAIFTVWHSIAVAAAAALTSLAVFRFTRSLAASAAIGMAAASSAAMLPALTPPEVTAIAISAATACAVLGGNSIGAIIGLLVGGAISPPVILPNVILGWLLTRRRARAFRAWQAFAAAVVLVVAAAAVALSLPVISDAGPLMLALAAFGVFTMASAGDGAGDATGPRRLILALGFPAAAVVAVLIGGIAPIRALAPFIVGVWLLAGAGIAALVSRAGGRYFRAGGFAIAAVLAAIHLAPRINPPPTAAEQPPRLGHETLTRRHFQELLYQLPTDSALIADDAVTAVLLRSLAGSLERAHKRITVVPRTPEDVAAAKRVSRVFALPRAQAELQERGVRFVEDAALPISGLAEVEAVLPCDVLATDWRTIPSAIGVTRLAMIAGDDAARGPIVVYTGAPASIEATPIAWPPLAMRGFYTRSYDRAIPERRQGLADEIANDGAPAGAAAVNTAHVARTELWRVPGAPHALTFALSAPSSTVIASQLARGTGPISLCPVFPFTVRRFN